MQMKVLNELQNLSVRMKIFNYLFHPELNNLRLNMNASLAQPLHKKKPRIISNKSTGENKRQKPTLNK